MSGVERERGWRIDRIPGKPVRREDERVLLPLWLLRDGIHREDLELNLSAVEAEELHAQLSRALGGFAESGGVPNGSLGGQGTERTSPM